MIQIPKVEDIRLLTTVMEESRLNEKRTRERQFLIDMIKDRAEAGYYDLEGYYDFSLDTINLFYKQGYGVIEGNGVYKIQWRDHTWDKI